MSTDIENTVEPTAASLVSGILGDLQRLVEQQFQLTRREIEEEVRQRASASGVLALGVGVLLLHGIVLCLSLAHLLHWAASPAGTDPAWFPLWACYAVWATVLIVIGGSLVQLGRVRFNSVAPASNPITEIAKENVPWTKVPK